MFLIARPSPDAVGSFLARSSQLPLSYDTAGMVSSPPNGFDLDEQVTVVGHGRQTFDRACQALMSWAHFDLGWIQVFPGRPSIEPGMEVAVLIRHLGFWSLNGGRVLSRWESSNDRPSCGFTYGTLINHAECGEELFEVVLDPPSDEVRYRIRAVSRPRDPFARLGRPYVRLLQARFRRESARALLRAQTMKIMKEEP